MTKPTFDINIALQALHESNDLTGKDGILTPLVKQLTEAAMQAELESPLGEEEAPNRKNGSSSTAIKSPVGSFGLQTPRDRAGTFEPQLVKKNQTHLTDELERIILAKYALGSSYQDIRGHIEGLYGVSLSNAAYIILALNVEGRKVLLGLYLSDSGFYRVDTNDSLVGQP